MNRAVVSIASNIAEGYARDSKQLESFNDKAYNLAIKISNFRKYINDREK